MTIFAYAAKAILEGAITPAKALDIFFKNDSSDEFKAVALSFIVFSI